MAPKSVTIGDVARAANVTKAAVSRVMNGKPGVSESTRQLVLQLSEELGWTPNRRARALATSRANCVGMVLARDAELLAVDPFFSKFIAGAEHVLASESKSLLLQVVCPGDQEANAYKILAAGQVDGVFLLDMRIDDPRPALLGELHLPAVVVGKANPAVKNVTEVYIDDTSGITAAVDHLIGQGHSQIAHVAGSQAFIHGVSRRKSWESVMASHNLDSSLLVEADFTPRSAALATAELLDRDRRPSAIVYANDSMALAGVSVAVDRGLSVPEDLSITGFDDIELAAHVSPTLTTVRVDVRGWGRAAATALLTTIAGRPPQVDELPEPELIVRNSTMPPRQ